MKKTKLTWLARAVGVTLSLFLVLAIFAACPDGSGGKNGNKDKDKDKVKPAPFTITLEVNDSSLGTATLGGVDANNKAISGTKPTVQVTVSDPDNYQLDSIFVGAGDPEMTSLGSGKYEFQMPHNAVTVTVLFGIHDKHTIKIFDFGKNGNYVLAPYTMTAEDGTTSQVYDGSALFSPEGMKLGYWAKGGDQLFIEDANKDGNGVALQIVEGPNYGYDIEPNSEVAPDANGKHPDKNNPWGGGFAYAPLDKMKWENGTPVPDPAPNGFDQVPSGTDWEYVTIWLKATGHNPATAGPYGAESPFGLALKGGGTEKKAIFTIQNLPAINTWIKVKLDKADFQGVNFNDLTNFSFLWILWDSHGPEEEFIILFDSIRVEPATP